MEAIPPGRPLQHVGRLPVILSAVQLVLLLATSVTRARNLIYGCTFFCGTSLHVVIGVLALVLSAAMFVLPTVIGALSREWKAAIVLAVAPWWIAMLLHAMPLLTPYFGLGGSGPGGRFDAPFWLDFNQAASLLIGFALFAALGWFGWLARQIFIRPQ